MLKMQLESRGDVPQHYFSVQACLKGRLWDIFRVDQPTDSLSFEFINSNHDLVSLPVNGRRLAFLFTM